MSNQLGSEQDQQNQTRNFVALVIHQIIFRVAWVFKTESVIMPAFMDHIAGAGWLRGFLPVLSRLGLSIPPLLLSMRLKNARQKKSMLMLSTLAMAIPFLVLSALWLFVGNENQAWLPYAFLVLYLLFFSAVGINHLAFGTVQGKLVRADQRGRLLSISGVVGTIFSVASLIVLMTAWLQRDDGGFSLIFGFTGFGFVISGLSVMWVKESSDEKKPTRWMIAKPFLQAWDVFVRDSGFRRLMLVSICFCPIILLFPHYQTLGRDGRSIQSSAVNLMLWVVTQNVAVGIYSFLAGWMADRFGNRIVIRLQMLVGAITPVVALTVARNTDGPEASWYWITFALLGIAPVTMRTLSNFNLELTEPANHPKYVSTLSLGAAVPFLLSPGIGYLIDSVGFTPVFLGCSTIVLIGFLITFQLPEPRHASAMVTRKANR